MLVALLTALSCVVLLAAGRLGAARDMSERLQVRLQKGLPGFALDVEWDAGDGVAVLFGPSGAGKTLTLQCLAGLHAAGCRAHRRGRPRALRLGGRAWILPRSAGASATSSRATRCSRTSPWPATSASVCATARAPSGPAASAEVMARLGLGGLAQRYPRRALRRPAPARGPGPRARHRSGAAPARRAAVRARSRRCGARSATSCGRS